MFPNLEYLMNLEDGVKYLLKLRNILQIEHITLKSHKNKFECY